MSGRSASTGTSTCARAATRRAASARSAAAAIRTVTSTSLDALRLPVAPAAARIAGYRLPPRSQVVPQPGRGSFRLPRREKRMRVLLIEDDAPLARGLVAALKLAGLAVAHEADGEEAARLAVSEPYSLVVLDIGLPSLSGFEVLRRIRAAECSVPVMMLTARDAVADRVCGL